jgi:uncharacterized protein YbjT (DUF2867 family)
LAGPGAALAPAVAELVGEVHRGDVTQPESLRGLCDGADAVFSSVSLMGKREGKSWNDVDYLGNVNLLREALRAGVSRFAYVSSFNAHRMLHVPIVAAHERFANELAKAPIESIVIRPTGYFSDMGAFFAMARSGRVYLIGDAATRLNPIHGADLAVRCADALTRRSGDIDVGGPEVLTYRQIAECAFAALEKPPRVTVIPLGAARAAVAISSLVVAHRAKLWQFFVEGAAVDHVAPPHGTRTLAEHFRALARAR